MATNVRIGDEFLIHGDKETFFLTKIDDRDGDPFVTLERGYGAYGELVDSAVEPIIMIARTQILLKFLPSLATYIDSRPLMAEKIYEARIKMGE